MCYNCDSDQKIEDQFVKSFKSINDNFLVQMLVLRLTTTQVYQQHCSLKARAFLKKKELCDNIIHKKKEKDSAKVERSSQST